MFEHFRLEVDPGQTPLRIDKYMSAHLEDTSRNRIQQAFKEGYVRVGETPVKANYIVRPGDVIRFVMPYRRRGLEIIPQEIPSMRTTTCSWSTNPRGWWCIPATDIMRGRW